MKCCGVHAKLRQVLQSSKVQIAVFVGNLGRSGSFAATFQVMDADVFKIVASLLVFLVGRGVKF